MRRGDDEDLVLFNAHDKACTNLPRFGSNFDHPRFQLINRLGVTQGLVQEKEGQDEGKQDG